MIDCPALALLCQTDSNFNYTDHLSHNFNVQQNVNISKLEYNKAQKSQMYHVIQDSGATGHYWPASMLHLLEDIEPTSELSITLPDQSRLRSTYRGYFHHNILPRHACRVHVFPRLAHALFSVPTFCAAGAIATFTKDQVYITLKGEPVFTGYPRGRPGLWFTDIPEPPPMPLKNHVHSPSPSVHNGTESIPPSVNLVHPELHGTNAQRIQFYQRALCFPARVTLYRAARYLNAFRTFPGLSPRLISRHFQLDETTALGRLDRTRKNYASTRPSVTFANDPSPSPIPTTPDVPIAPRKQTPVWVKTSRLYTDLSGRLESEFYILVMYFEDLNVIYLAYLTDKSGTSYRKAYTEGMDWYSATERGRSTMPHFEVCDAAIDQLTAKMLADRGITYTLVPTGNHRRNNAERCVRTAENYVTCAFQGCDPTCSTKARRHMLPQIRIVINLMRPSRLNPQISAWEDLKGVYDFNAHPIAPLGSPVIAFVPPDDRPKLAPHGVPAFYVGPALNHYRCYTVYVPETNRTRITDTIAWLPFTNERIPTAPPGVFLPPRPPDAPPTPATVTAQDAVPQPHAHEPDHPHDFNNDDDYPPPPIQGATILPRDPRNLWHVPTSPPQIPTVTPPPTTVPPPGPPVQPRVSEGEPNPATSLPPHSEGETATTPKPPAKPPRPATPRSRKISKSELPLPPPADDSVFPKPRRASGSRFINLLVASGLSLTALNAVAQSNRRPTITAKSPQFFRDEVPITANVLTPMVNVPPRPILHGTTSYAKLRQGPDKVNWDAAFADELRRLIYRTESIRWIPDGKIPQGKRATYANPVGRIKHEGSNRTFRVRLAYGGDQSDYAGDRTSFTVDYSTVKCLLNAIVTENADHITLDLEDFYLYTTLDEPEYMRMPLAIIPMDLRKELRMDHLPDSTSILWEVLKGLYGMPQAGLLAQKDLNRLLTSHGYLVSSTTPGLYTHVTRKIKFVVWVDDFLIKFARGDRKDINHLLDVLATRYKFRVDWSGRKYLGLTIHHQRQQRCLTVSMPGYVERMLSDLGIFKQAHDPRSPIVYVSPTMATGPQMEHVDSSPPLDDEGRTFIQRVVGKALFFGRLVSPLIECAVNRIGSLQAKPTQDVLKAALRLCQYLAHHPNHSITYRPSNMRLVIHTDAAHSSEPRARSRAGGYFTLGDSPYTGPTSSDPYLVNGPVATVCSILPTVCQASSESEYAAAYCNAQLGEALRQTLHDLGYPQTQPTPLIYDNEVAGKIANQTCKLKRAKAIAMRYHWLRDRVAMGHFIMVWRPGAQNLADLFTKAHPVHHFEALTPFYNSSARRGF